MKTVLRSVIGLIILLTVGPASGIILDPLWMFSDEGLAIYQYFQYCDTARTDDYLCQAKESDQIPDTGDSYDGSQYINWEYQFSSDSLFFRDEFDNTIVHYRDCRPGFAGFKTAWDYGMTGFPIARYKYLVFAHKGPNANHKVTVRAWFNNGECGSTDYVETIGTFNASAEWKVDSIAIPDSIRNKGDMWRNKGKYYELVFIINNINPNDTTSGSPGILKIDNLRLEGCNPIDISPVPHQIKEGDPATFTVETSRADTADVLTYQWKKDGVVIPGANNPAYTIAAVTAEHVGVYDVDVTVSGSGLTFSSYGAPLIIGDTKVKQEYKPTVERKVNSASEENNGCGCGSGVGLAFIPPLGYRILIRRKRKKRS